MSDKFQNGLHLPTIASQQTGRAICRWLFEWATLVLGWTDLDKSGSKWDNHVATGSDGQSVSGYVNRFSIGTDAHDFSGSDVGAYLTIPGITPVGFAGIYRITRVLTTKIVEIDYQYSVHCAGIPCNLTGLNWYLWRNEDAYLPDATDWFVLVGTGTTGSGYSFHLRVEVDAYGTNTLGLPKFQLSPFASWDDTGHAWTDSRYISELAWANYYSSIDNQPSARIWAAGDTDRMVLMVRFERHGETYDNGYYCWHFLYLGEIDTFHASQDAKPCVLWEGSNYCNIDPGEDDARILGYDAQGNLNGRGKWLTYDDVTTVDGHLMLAHVPTNDNLHWMSQRRRRYSALTGDRLISDLICECRDSSYQELRGKLRRVWATGREHARVEPFGLNNEYLHLIGGMTIPWNGSRCFYVR